MTILRKIFKKNKKSKYKAYSGDTATTYVYPKIRTNLICCYIRLNLVRWNNDDTEDVRIMIRDIDGSHDWYMTAFFHFSDKTIQSARESCISYTHEYEFALDPEDVEYMENNKLIKIDLKLEDIRHFYRNWCGGFEDDINKTIILSYRQQELLKEQFEMVKQVPKSYVCK